MKKVNNKDIAQEVAKILLRLKAVTLNPKKPYRFTSGILSPVYTDCRLLISTPRERKKIVRYFLETIRATKNKFDVIAGTATAGIPHAAWIAEKMNLPMIYVRSRAKEHGKGNQIEGFIKKGQTAVVVEDLISTGGSSGETVDAIRNSGGKAKFIFSIITYEMQKSKNNFRAKRVKLFPLTTFKKVVSVAVKNKYIKKEDEENILEWAKDPPSWGKRMGFE